jgi:hypothetical protein
VFISSRQSRLSGSAGEVGAGRAAKDLPRTAPLLDAPRFGLKQENPVLIFQLGDREEAGIAIEFYSHASLVAYAQRVSGMLDPV